MAKSSSHHPITGVGVSARPQHFEELLNSEVPAFPWLEVLADNYLHEDSISHQRLRALTPSYPLVFHCVGMSLGSSTDFHWDYLKKLKKLIRLIKPQWISDHLCFSSFGPSHYHDLIPLPYTQSMVKHIKKKLSILQDFFEIPLLLENVTNYMSYASNEMSEAEFLNEILAHTHVDLLLDINNIYVNSFNHKFDPYAFVNQIDFSRVKQIHLAGFTDNGSYLVDTHSKPVHQEVQKLYQHTLQRSHKPIPVCLEWDEDIPDFPTFQREQKKIEQIFQSQENIFRSTIEPRYCENPTGL